MNSATTVFLDEGDGYERNAYDIGSHVDLSVGAIKDWTTARQRWIVKSDEMISLRRRARRRARKAYVNAFLNGKR